MGSLLGVFLHAIGGFAAGSFYIPIKKVRGWSWESAWLVLGLMAWVIAPLFVALLTVHDSIHVWLQTPKNDLVLVYFFGLLWGIGGLTFGLSMRYLGISLGMTVALGLCTAFGTLVPPIFKGNIDVLYSTSQGIITLLGIFFCLVGIGIVGYAGIRKERELISETNDALMGEFNLKKGIIVAMISGVLSACFAFALDAGTAISELTAKLGTPELFKNNLLLVYILWGGMTTNCIYSLYLNHRHKSCLDYENRKVPLAANYFWAMLGGLTWYLQFFFYGMGTTYIGEKLEFASWSIHMSFIILFSNIWGLYYNEWKGISLSTKSFLAVGLLVVFISILMIGMADIISNYL